jgi:two-component system, NtrC family, nitrogen regulation response regulator NtrX
MAADILVVDDEADIRMLIGGLLADEGYTTREAGNSDEALAAIRQRQPNLVVLDIWLQGSTLDGLQILEVIKREYPSLPVLMISGHGSTETTVEAMRLGAVDFIDKPFKSEHLLVRIGKALEDARMRREVAELRSKLGTDGDLLGQSVVINAVRQLVDRVSPTNSRVLITGPAGVGKEVVARMIHQRSKRADGPFVILNCATLRPERFEMELFGGDGASDAAGHTAKIGTFEQAHGGTLLLDEVADMPLETQGKIVRVLQEQTFQRVGGKEKVSVDVRVIASTNRDLQREMNEGHFRQDLYYRLNVVPIQVPSLRQRREDIPILAGYFVSRLSETQGLQVRLIGEDAMAVLMSHDWPGNVRDLRNVIERMLIMAPGDPSETIRAEAIIGVIGAMADSTRPNRLDGEIMAVPLREARELFERQYLEAQVTRFDGNVAKTAAFIGMERSALYRKLRSLGLTPNDRSAATEE